MATTPLGMKWEHFSWSQDRNVPVWKTGSSVSREPDKSISLLYGTPLAVILEKDIFSLTVSPNRLGQPSPALSKITWVASRDFSFHSGVRTVFLDMIKFMKFKQNPSFSFTISTGEWG